MKKYKKNITVQLACILTESLICSIPMVFILLFLVPAGLAETFECILMALIMIVVINLFLYIISLIAKLFIKAIYIINNNDLIIQKNNKERIIDLKSVNFITYDLGELKQPSKLVLFDKDYKELLAIENPPLMMVAHIKKKCYFARVSYYNSKRFLFLLLLYCGIAVVISLIGLIAK